ncbi:ParB/RepB/Spo0J family partition protein [Streptomyces parvus]|uniref:ParB/RepB/Spo0J family partition protein n=1 Tax=Streptomyces parvus TaxID=66428 RepID=UPI003714377B
MNTKNTPVEPLGVLNELGELVELDPEMVVLDERNARTQNVKPDAGLLASVERIGVQEPISVRPLGDGRYGVFKGQRRWLAALAAKKKAATKGKPWRPIPAFVRASLTDADHEALLLSLVENTQRVRMTHHDQVNGAAQLELIGTSETERRRAASILGIKREQLKAAKKAAELSTEGMQDGDRYGFDLIELADLQEVEAVSGAAETLARAKRQDQEARKGNGHWKHALAALRQRQDEARKVAAATQALEEAGVKVLPRPRWHDDARALSELTTATGRALTPEAHSAACAGHAAWLDDEMNPIYFCTRPQEYGHRASDGPTVEEETRAKEEERKYRKTVIEQNRAARAAREVRHSFITQLCKGKSVSDGGWLLILSTVVNGSDVYRRFLNKTGDKAAAMVGEFAGATPEKGSEPFAKAIRRTGKARRPQLLLAQVAAAYESAMGDKAWANPTADDIQWLEFLAAEGYTLSDHERGVIEAFAKRQKPDAEADADADADAKAGPEADAEADAEAEPDAEPDALK